MTMPPRILLTGGEGQLGNECRLLAPPDLDLVAVDLPDFDLMDPSGCVARVREVRPDMLLHVGAWTAVDLAEEKEEEAFAVNATATTALAEEMARLGGRMVYVSTDYVFSGQGDTPWRESDPVAPLNAYGRTKLAGEQAMAEVLGARGHVVRTSWLYGRRGANFVRTMLHLMQAGRALKVVDDQWGSPTWAGGLAAGLFALAAGQEAPPILHFTDGGILPWCTFAEEIRRIGLDAGLDLEASSVSPCPGTEYPTPAPRPAWSPLHFSDAWAGLGIVQTPWQEALHHALPLLVSEDDKLMR